MAEVRAAREDAVSGRGVLLGVGGVAIAIVVTLVAARMLLHAWRPAESGGIAPAPTAPLEASAPIKLQPDPVRDIEAYRGEQRKRLSSYAWVDRERGIVRIPIEQAMQALASGQASAGDAR